MNRASNSVTQRGVGLGHSHSCLELVPECSHVLLEHRHVPPLGLTQGEQAGDERCGMRNVECGMWNEGIKSEGMRKWRNE